jgi:hypothetical protein
MPPQQLKGLLDFVGHFLMFGAHGTFLARIQGAFI